MTKASKITKQRRGIQKKRAFLLGLGLPLTFILLAASLQLAGGVLVANDYAVKQVRALQAHLVYERYLIHRDLHLPLEGILADLDKTWQVKELKDAGGHEIQLWEKAWLRERAWLNEAS